MQKFEPRPCKSVSKLVRVLMELLRHSPICRVFNHRHVSSGHHRCDFHRRIIHFRRHIFFSNIHWVPDMRTSRAFGQLPVIFKKQLKITIIPLGRIGCPRPFNSAGCGIAAFSSAIAVCPSEAHLMNRGAFRFCSDKLRVTGAVRFTKSMAAGDQRDSLFIIHRHTSECFTYILCAQHRVWICVRSLWVDINQPHLHCSKRI